MIVSNFSGTGGQTRLYSPKLIVYSSAATKIAQ